MRSLRYGLVLEVRKDAIREENGDTVVTDPASWNARSGIAFGQEPEADLSYAGGQRGTPFFSSAGGLFRGRMMTRIAQ